VTFMPLMPPVPSLPSKARLMLGTEESSEMVRMSPIAETPRQHKHHKLCFDMLLWERSSTSGTKGELPEVQEVGRLERGKSKKD